MWDARLPIQAAGCETARALDADGQGHHEAGPPSVGKSGQIYPSCSPTICRLTYSPKSQSLRGIVRSGLKEALEDPIAGPDGDPDAMVADGKPSVPGATAVRA